MQSVQDPPLDISRADSGKPADSPAARPSSGLERVGLWDDLRQAARLRSYVIVPKSLETSPRKMRNATPEFPLRPGLRQAHAGPRAEKLIIVDSELSTRKSNE